MTLHRGPAGKIQQLMRDRHVATLKLRMPVIDERDQEIVIQSNPRSTESDLDASELNDAESLYMLIEGRRHDDKIYNKFDGSCQVSRRSVPYVEGGPAPADDYNNIWDVIIPGGVPDEVVVGQVALIFPDLDTPLSLNGLRRVYTINAIAQDRLKYVARLTMVEYGLIKSGGRSG